MHGIKVIIKKELADVDINDAMVLSQLTKAIKKELDQLRIDQVT